MLRPKRPVIRSVSGAARLDRMAGEGGVASRKACTGRRPRYSRSRPGRHDSLLVDISSDGLRSLQPSVGPESVRRTGSAKAGEGFNGSKRSGDLERSDGWQYAVDE
jgi:hypothetical protein